MPESKLVIVIHAEEEFDWNSGFYRSNRNVTHSDNLIATIDQIIGFGGKVTLAMDYPFVTSEGGQTVINYYKNQHGKNVEFATHLHPWVNPPYETNDDSVSNELSYPGNLSEELEYQKLKVLTEEIEKTCGFRPKTYLAGRYGIGKNTQSIIKRLGYEMDLSISAYCDFSHQQGPDFSNFTNTRFQRNQVTYLPHTSAILSVVPWIRNYMNRNPEYFSLMQENKVFRIIGKFLRLKRYRLSPEGFTFRQMKQVTESLLKVEQNEFIMSFHSPSTKQGLTPYVSSLDDVNHFRETISEYIKWFNEIENSRFVIAQELLKEGRQ
ncbi:hypothetical protein [Vibrio salinus]|uniref:hypothetical protein n=1 Tax=Vibrio salinus TaxID=2899784 RepID=UPI001E5795D6|nr:hypothetical protein [Vibrio salinus]MCE0493275.1 hypothetical protein [Vibrio salinus]